MSLRSIIVAGAALLCLLTPTFASAHDFSPGVLALHRESHNDYHVMWTEPVDSKGAAAGVSLVLPASCALNGLRLHCDHGLAGILRFEGMTEPRMQIIVSVHRASGQHDQYIVTGDAPSLDFGKPSPNSALLWLRIGAEHILGGLDHIAFVVGLLLLLHLRASRQLFWTITAFTVAHSITLTLAALDYWRLPSNPVEACIALSVLLLAVEIIREHKGVMHSAPWLVSGVFGLVHGMGFAGALTRLGLPQDSIVSSLLFFNLGVEAGQLLVVATILLTALVLKRYRPQLAWLRPTTCYAMGALSAYWLLARTIMIVS